MSRVKVIGVLLITIVVLSFSALLPWLMVTGSGPFAGTTIGGHLPDRTLPFSDWVEQESRRLGELRIQVTSDQFVDELPAAALGISIDVSAMMELARRQTQNGPIWSRCRRALAARLSIIDYAWLTQFDHDKAQATLVKLAASVDRAPVDAELDLARRRQVHASAGSRLDVERTLEYIESHRSVDLAIVPLTVADVQPRVRDEDVLGIDVDSVLSQFETDFHTRAGPRAANIRVAARTLSGQVLGPGATFSFNRVVGPRIEARGYREAPVIVGDELEPGVGGGVCQVATTLHAAAVMGGIEVLERRSHSRPSGYAPLGLDATVIDGEVDLKLRNPYSVPLGILTSFPDRFRLRVEFVGLSPPARFEHTIAIVKRYEFYRRLSTKAEVALGSFQKKQKGSFGFDVISTVTASFGNGSITRHHYRSRYWPVPEVYWIGADTELSVLPPLPEGATGVMLDGTTVIGTIPPEVEDRLGKAEQLVDSFEQ